MQLKNKKILIVGGSGFLGKYFDQAITREGGVAIVADVSGDFDVELDVTDQKSIDTAFEQVLAEHGHLDAVVNSAALDPKFDQGVAHNQKDFMNYPEELMQKTVDVNLLGAWRVCKSAVKNKIPNIVNVASFYGLTPPRQEIYPQGTEKPVDYPITKAGVIMLTRHLASQFGKDGIRCNALAPGGVLKGHAEDFQEKYAQHTSLKRMNAPEEVADSLVFLLSDSSRGMTGETLVVDNGWVSR